jgi:DNA-binding beta-propeller fold protein YncE
MNFQQKLVACVLSPVAWLSVEAFTAAPGAPDIAVSSNDNHSVMINGAIGARPDCKPDTLSVLDLTVFPPKILQTIEAPGSVVGPPMAVAIARDGSFAVVACSSKVDPQNSSRLTPDDRVSVIDLKSSPPRVVQQITAGAGANAVALSPDEQLALVANRSEGTVSIFTIQHGQLQPAGKLDLGNPKSGPSGIRFLPDGKTAVLARDADHMINVLHINGTSVTVEPRPITTGVKPYTLDISPDGRWAAISNMGRGNGDMDTVSLIDLSQSPFRTVETFSVASAPEGVKFSPDGKFLAVVTHNGTTEPAGSPFSQDHGLLFVYSMEGAPHHLKKIDEQPVGKWPQGIAFSKDGSVIVAQDMADRDLSVFKFKQGKLTAPVHLPMDGGPVSLSTPW